MFHVTRSALALAASMDHLRRAVMHPAESCHAFSAVACPALGKAALAKGAFLPTVSAIYLSYAAAEEVRALVDAGRHQ
jgi:hypothetical protein